ncbi:MAG: hypothetical protein GWO21_18145, partial [Gammaproteobacteria bacterium]|nr:hypothetical protein [Gammaproteobacteria bacterium]
MSGSLTNCAGIERIRPCLRARLEAYGGALDKFDRIYQLHGILQARRTPVSREDLMIEL